MNDFKIGNISIGLSHRPIIIAEMSGNHNQSLERALDITEAAAATDPSFYRCFNKPNCDNQETRLDEAIKTT